VKGRVSFSLQAPMGAFNESAPVKVNGFNFVFFDVPQVEITKTKPRGKATGVLGFAIDRTWAQQLEYDRGRNLLTGELSGYVDFPQLAELEDPVLDSTEHNISTLRLESTVNVEIHLLKRPRFKIPKRGVRQIRSTIQARMQVDGLPTFSIDDFVVLNPTPDIIFTKVALGEFYSTIKHLCLQPIRIATYEIGPPVGQKFNLVNLSGAGLDFGMPGADTEWAKADVRFDVRDWDTIIDLSNEYLPASPDAAYELFFSVGVYDDCIEIFFVDSLDPEDYWGGGSTMGGATASAQIVTSDDNAYGGIDETHLAHELGHVLSLCHPDSGCPDVFFPDSSDGSAGTLMCLSGYLNDNPQINSAENAGSVSNPLIIYVLAPIPSLLLPDPDCSDSVDCGSCP
jgi:hypothetical protein